MYFIYKDHLGSICYVTDAPATVIESMSYDAWGKRRNPADWTYLQINQYPTLFDRGYTQHEHMDEFELINMNGRLYDPVLGRFLSPDIFIQSPGNTQAYNRYSYCINNGLKYTDPTGNLRGPSKIDLNKLIKNIDFDYIGKLFSNLVGKPSKYILEGTYDYFWAPIAWNLGFHHAIFTGSDHPFSDADRQATNSCKITHGLFITDESSGNPEWQLFSRFFLQNPVTDIGFFTAQGANFYNDDLTIEYFHGATLIVDPNAGYYCDIGGFIRIDNAHPIDFNNYSLLHEYGHFLQTRNYGGFVTFFSGIVSASNYSQSTYFGHDCLWVEQDANSRSLKYFSGRPGFDYNRFLHDPSYHFGFYDSRLLYNAFCLSWITYLEFGWD